MAGCGARRKRTKNLSWKNIAAGISRRSKLHAVCKKQQGRTGASRPAYARRSSLLLMIVGGAAPEMLSPYPRDLDVKEPTQPFVMFPGKPTSTR